MSVRLRVHRETLRKALEEFPEEAYQVIRDEMLTGVQEIRDMIVKGRLSGTPLARRTGDLARSFAHLVEGEALDGLTGIVYSTSPYARIHEHGGTVTPKRAQFLVIPLPDALTASGVQRFPVNYEAGQTLRTVLKEAGFIKTGVARTHRGTLILWGQRSLAEPPEELFLLVRSVTIPARMGAVDLFHEHMVEVSRRMQAELRRLWQDRGKQGGKKRRGRRGS